MTIIIALKDKKNKNIILGTDTQATGGQIIYTVENKTITLPLTITDGYNETIKETEIHILFTGYTYLRTFIEYGFTTPAMNEQQNFIEYLYQDFLPILKETLQEDNLVEINNNVTDIEGGFIIIYQDQIYNINSRLSVDQPNEDYSINGSGSEVALGSLYTNLKYHPDLDYKEIVKQAIETCGDNTLYCNNTVKIKTIPY